MPLSIEYDEEVLTDMFCRKLGMKVSLLLILIISLSGIVYGNEQLPKDVAKKLGVSEDVGKRFETLYEYEPTETDKERSSEEYNKIITKVSYAHGGKYVHLWKIEFVEGYSVSGNTINLYLDSDNNVETGRQRDNPLWDGIDVLWTLNNAEDEWRLFGYNWNAFGEESRMDYLATFIPYGNSLYCRYDLMKNKEGSQFVFRARLTSEIPGKTVHRTPWLDIKAKVYD